MYWRWARQGEDSASQGVDVAEDDNTAADSGAVYVFERSAGEWAQLKYVKAPNAEGGDAFGSSLSLDASGDTLAVGAPGEDSAATGIDRSQTDNEQGKRRRCLFVLVLRKL